MELSKEEEIKKAKEILELASELYEKYRPVYKWISGEEAMKILKIKKTKLQQLRDNNKIVISQLSSKHILYDITSIEDYIERNSNRKDVIK